MAAPNVAIFNLEPSETEVVLFAATAPTLPGGPEGVRLLLTLTLTNAEATPVQLQDLRVVIPISGHDIERSFALEAGGAPLTIPPSKQVQWTFTDPSQAIMFTPGALPTEIRLEVRAAGYADPAIFKRAMRPHRTPAPPGAYRFPAEAHELEREFWHGHGGVHVANTAQSYGYDLHVWGRYADSDPQLKAAADKTKLKNEDYRAWGKRVYAMADGIVRHAANTVPENPRPLPPNDPVAAAEQANLWGSLPAELRAQAGNHLHIEHGTETVQYAHLQRGSIPARLLAPAARVAAGEFLGLVGNSGNSSEPHLHLHAVRGTNVEAGPGMPLEFGSAWFVDFSYLKLIVPVPWVRAEGRALPPTDTAIWPSAPPPLEAPIEHDLVDPLSIVVSSSLYLKLKAPDPPPTGVLVGIVEQLAVTASAGQRQEAMVRLGAAVSSLSAVVAALESPGG